MALNSMPHELGPQSPKQIETLEPFSAYGSFNDNNRGLQSFDLDLVLDRSKSPTVVIESTGTSFVQRKPSPVQSSEIYL